MWVKDAVWACGWLNCPYIHSVSIARAALISAFQRPKGCTAEAVLQILQHIACNVERINSHWHRGVCVLVHLSISWGSCANRAFSLVELLCGCTEGHKGLDLSFLRCLLNLDSALKIHETFNIFNCLSLGLFFSNAKICISSYGCRVVCLYPRGRVWFLGFFTC